MSCALALIASLAMADAYALPRQAPAAVSPLASEPLYADIVSRARSLKSEVLAIEDLEGLAQSPEPKALDRLAAIALKAEALSKLDMKGHFDLAARARDGDLKCILKGVAEDLPRKVAEVRAARTGAAEKSALGELAYLLNDNVEVITAPPRPPT